ncbi:MAG: hypothetical protein C0629_08930 [Chromatiales bacterium]|nr:MAG: hypothetical protein C0629_08930 [Chromatiales bacterium]
MYQQQRGNVRVEYVRMQKRRAVVVADSTLPIDQIDAQQVRNTSEIAALFVIVAQHPLIIASQDGCWRRLRLTGQKTPVKSFAASQVGVVLHYFGSIRLRTEADAHTGLFEQAFGRGPGMESIGMALASYQRVLLAADSPFDRWFFDADESALSATARHGYELFSGVAGCAGCHTISRSDPLFTDQQFHNTGVGYLSSFSGRGRGRELEVAPGTILTVDTWSLDNVGGRRQSDLGLYELTGRPADRWKYRTPSLRNVALTAPYMHDGSLPTLEAVVRFYNEGGIENEGRDPRIRRLGLDDTDVAALVDFLEALTGSNVARLVADARGQK